MGVVGVETATFSCMTMLWIITTQNIMINCRGIKEELIFGSVGVQPDCPPIGGSKALQTLRSIIDNLIVLFYPLLSALPFIMFQFSDYPLKPAPTTSASQLEKNQKNGGKGNFPQGRSPLMKSPLLSPPNPNPTDVACAKYTVDSGSSEDI